MKITKYILILTLVALAITITACEEEQKTEEPEETPNKFEACEDLGGTPLTEHNECEYITEDACEELNGEYFPCESACRHDPDYPDVICTMQCVPVCVFN